jgi:hypothetical protein
LGVGFLLLFSLVQLVAAEPGAQIPSLLQNGFTVWAKQGVSYAFDVWKKGGLLENDNKPAVLSNYFRGLDRTLGNYRTYEAINTKQINGSSQIVYLAINFEHAAVYGRFLLYRADKDWVVQNMDFSLKPELIMPWLAFEGVNYAE